MRYTFDMLSGILTTSSGAFADVSGAFQAQGLAYVGFALAHPERFQVMFGPYGAGSGQPLGGVGPSGLTPYELLAAALDELAAAEVIDATAREDAEPIAWSSVHGLASLLISGALKTTGGAAGHSRVTGEVVRCLLSGLQARGRHRAPGAPDQRP